jgi:hypothetical protein
MQATKVKRLDNSKYFDGLLLKNKYRVLNTRRIKISDNKLSINHPVLKVCGLA